MVPRLSKNRVGRDCIGTRSSDSSGFTHCSSVVAVTIARYLALVEERATMRCFVALQEIGLAPRNIRKTHVDV